MITRNDLKKLISNSVALLVVCLAGCASHPTGIPVGSSAETVTASTSPAIPADTKPLAFPGAEGFGKYTTGGRGGQVVYVTNLEDSGEGSLRKAIQKKGPRIIVFAVSGTIALKEPLDINNGDVTIAGQSAPGDGIAIRNYPVNVKADNVILRYLRFRLGDVTEQQEDALSGNKGRSNIIIDHCSMSWATDECASFYRNKNFTLQWSIVSESLNRSVHAKGDHGYGGIWGGERASFHHNLIANHSSRTPRFSGSKSTPNSPDELVDFRNNVIFNWVHNSSYGGEKGRYNMVNNYYKAGPATNSSKEDRIVNPSQPYGKFYVNGNHVEGYPAITKNNWAGGVQANHPDSARAVNPFEVAAIKEQTAAQAYELVLGHAGASHKRDAVDARVVADVRSGKPTSGSKKNGIIDSQQDVGGWPELKSAPAPEDKDQDGMPDAWELQQNLNPNDPADAAGYTLDKQYTNVEVYLNSLVKPTTEL
ncbi:pectate lyase [Pontibacter sp. FD36]|uniref:pectate lyase family protein n=1 Tax=Pontibacter sp. FD36 TaxID=2789860 RepID=UPI0018AC5271|nr:pectate lyase [Pontibacter sp. FD36]MBF8963600.1 pectate lyase [Pontibacter sp. FD36]